MNRNNKILGNLMITVGMLGIIIEFVTPMLVISGCFGGNPSKILQYLFFGVIILGGIGIKKYKAVR